MISSYWVAPVRVIGNPIDDYDTMRRLTTKGFHFYEGQEKWLIHGVTYGPFRPNHNSEPYPEEELLHRDFKAISAMGANTVRLYSIGGKQVASISSHYGLQLLIDIPWPKHIDVYNSKENQNLCLKMVEEGIRKIQEYPNVTGVFLGNEIPADLVRWAGKRRVQAFLRRLYNYAKSLAPDLLMGYANFPSTEYLQLGFFDFIGFNVYLHEPSVFEDYLIRLRHLYPEKPLILSEVGLDTQRHGLSKQAHLLSDNLRIAYEVGMAGAVVFTWTDEWHTGGYDITDWSFGIVDRDRRPKPSLQAVSQVFKTAPQCTELEHWPKISVIVAAYNESRTLRECLKSLESLIYPGEYEIIVVDDGSTDDTPVILNEFSDIQVITQPNKGLSAARNAGIEAATGEITAFTDADCFADPDWLYHIVIAMERDSVVGVGGPNLTPDENRLAAQCVSLAPGQPTHVLLNHNEAEHIPGCNMAFRRDVLLEINGFDTDFRKAGDDVDLIWRLQDLNYKIGFSTAAFVWHHRRPTFKGYLKQQMGYGESESILLRKHPQRFNERGLSIWQGTIYASKENQALLGKPNIHYGVFCSSGYQCIYEQKESKLFYMITSVEWWFFCFCLFIVGYFAPLAFKLGFLGAVLSLVASGTKAWRTWSESGKKSLVYFPIVWCLWIVQPILRGGMRYWSRLKIGRISPKFTIPSNLSQPTEKPRYQRAHVLEYWSDSAPPRLEVVRRLEQGFDDSGWIYTPNTPWEPWDLSLILSWWFNLYITTAEEKHGGAKRLLRLRFSIVPTNLLYMLGTVILILCALMAIHDTMTARWMLVGFLVVFWFLYRHALHKRSLVEKSADSLIKEIGFSPIKS